VTSAFVTNPTDTSAPRSLTPSGRKAIRTLLVVAAVVVTLSAVVGVGGVAWGIASLRVAADTQTLPASMESLTIDTGQAPTAIRITSDRNLREPKVRMRLLNASSTDAGALTVARNGNTIGLTIAGTPSQLMNFGPPGEITVTLPPDVARRLSVTTRQRTGLLFSQSELSQLTVHNTDGVVVLDGDARRIEIDTQSGEIRTRDAISVTEAFTADTDDGHIAVDFRDAAPRTVQVTGRDADIEIALPPVGPYLVRAQAGNELKVFVPQTDDASRAAAEVTAQAQDGSVTITTRR
jgi:hypothetical protein